MRSTAPLALLLVVACGGCSDRALAQLPDDAARRYAAALCAAEAACGCQRYSSVAACETDVMAAFERATVAISSFDEACFEELLTNLAERGCAKATEPFVTCTAIIGSATIGEPCERDRRMQLAMFAGTCEAGGTCDPNTGQCSIDYSFPSKELGDPCDPSRWSSCGTELYCQPEGVCEARTAEGEACSDPHECEAGSFCATDAGVCTPLVETGQPCNPDDWTPCKWFLTPESKLLFGWCNPQTLLCEAGIPHACWAFI
jgi:hypothetical protein